MSDTTSFVPLLFGNDINVYSVARAFHEAYGLTATVFGKYANGLCPGSSIIDYHACETTDEAATMLSEISEFAGAHPDKTVIAMGCGDSYVRQLSGLLGELPDNVLAPYIAPDLMDRLVLKERFYELADEHGIDHPRTFVYRAEMGHDFELPFDGPFICKPSDGPAYWEHPFQGMEKVFTLPDRATLESTLDAVYAAGYPDAMIVQEFIPGDDSYMRVLTSYSDAVGRVRSMCLGHVLLEEHQPYGIGNHAVIITEPNDELYARFKGLLESLHFTGFSNFDIKYDERDDTYKAFEINCRQGRSNYYVTGAGMNVARSVVSDRIEHEPYSFTTCQDETLWMVVPEKIAFDFTPTAYHERMRALVSAGKVSNPLRYPAETGLMHKLRVERNMLRHRSNFETYYHRFE